MLHIETHGSWRQIGQQIGETFRDWFGPVLDRFAPWLKTDADTYRPAINAIRAVLDRHAPELWEETVGMAEALNHDPQWFLGLRFFNEVRHYMPVGCSGLFLADSDRGPLLARTCDIEPDLGAQIQISNLRRPSEGPASISLTYLSMVGTVGINEHGLGLTGSSASADHIASTEGLPVAVINHLIMNRCRSVAQACALLKTLTVRGKGVNELVADGSGQSVLLELVTGRPAIQNPRRPERDWQACSNFCYSKELTNASGSSYLENAYTRYGRICHQVGEDLMPRTLAGVKQLLLEIAQPGMVCHEPHCFFHTVYVFILELANRKMHLCPGHPAKTSYLELSL